MTLSTFSWFSYIQPFGFSVFLLRISFLKQKCDLSHLSVLKINMEISNIAFIILQGTYTMPTSCLSLPQASQSRHCRFSSSNSAHCLPEKVFWQTISMLNMACLSFFAWVIAIYPLDLNLVNSLQTRPYDTAPLSFTKLITVVISHLFIWQLACDCLPKENEDSEDNHICVCSQQ